MNLVVGMKQLYKPIVTHLSSNLALNIASIFASKNLVANLVANLVLDVKKISQEISPRAKFFTSEIGSFFFRFKLKSVNLNLHSEVSIRKDIRKEKVH